MSEATQTCTALWIPVKFIPLTNGKFAIVDAADYEWLKEYKWRYERSKNKKTGYAVHRCNKMGFVRMHRVIIGINNIATQIDHVDCDGTNNKRSNLRICTGSQNHYNVGIRVDNTSGFKGVTRRKKTGNFVAQININGKRTNKGTFGTAKEAFMAYKKAAIETHGEFARFD